MARISKEQKLHLEGMAFALRIAKKYGVEGLEKEIEFRGANSIPLNVNRYELTQVARMRAKDELMIVAIAMADALSNDMKFPPSVIVDFLRKFNTKIDVFRYDKEELEKAQLKLDSMYVLNETIKRFNQED